MRYPIVPRASASVSTSRLLRPRLQANGYRPRVTSMRGLGMGLLLRGGVRQFQSRRSQDATLLGNAGGHMGIQLRARHETYLSQRHFWSKSEDPILPVERNIPKAPGSNGNQFLTPPLSLTSFPPYSTVGVPLTPTFITQVQKLKLTPPKPNILPGY